VNIRRYSDNTIVAYVSFLQLFQSVFKIIDFEKLKDRDILNYCYKYIAHKGLVYSSQKPLLSAVKLFYKEIYGRYVNLDSVKPKHKPKSNPVILSKKEIKKLLNCVGNLKHKVMC
jgi:integrase/recombinase XerD